MTGTRTQPRPRGGPSRRAALVGCGAALLGTVGPGGTHPAAANPVPSLCDLGRRKGIEVGAAFSGHADPDYRALVAGQVGLITPEWCLKPGYVHPDRHGPYRFAAADEAYRFARSAALGVHGHTLFWHGDPLAWAAELGPSEGFRAYRDVAAALVSRYPDTVSWDVANEVVSETGPLWRGQLGLPVNAEAVAGLFRHVGALAPKRLLCLNDYNLECGAAWCRDKQARMIRAVDELRARGAPVGAIGLQGHLSSRHGLDLDATLAFVRQLASRGLEVHLSELDVNDVVLADAVERRDEQVADLYRTYLSALLSEPAVSRITFWGLTDFDHWMTRGEAEDVRPAGQARPALFDRSLRPKPSFWAVAECLRDAPARRPSRRG